MATLRAGAALPLTGRYGPLAAQAARGLRAWAGHADATLELHDCGDDPERAAGLTRRLGRSVDILFGPYGSGQMRVVASTMAAEPAVVWNHGGAAVPRTGARIVDVLGPADSYWAGLPAALAGAGVPIDTVAVLHADSGFGNEVAAGAIRALRAAGGDPVHVATFSAASVAADADAARASGARVVVGCGRFEDDVALGRRLAGSGMTLALVACGVHAALGVLGDAVAGTFGPCQWIADASPPPAGLGADAEYPAVQAFAAGLLAERAIAAAGSTEPSAVWAAALAMSTRTLLGPFRVDRDGRQTAHRPLIVRWERTPDGLRRRVVWSPGDDRDV